MLDSASPNEEQLKLLVLGMQNFVGVLGNVMRGLGEAKASSYVPVQIDAGDSVYSDGLPENLR